MSRYDFQRNSVILEQEEAEWKQRQDEAAARIHQRSFALENEAARLRLTLQSIWPSFVSAREFVKAEIVVQPGYHGIELRAKKRHDYAQWVVKELYLRLTNTKVCFVIKPAWDGGLLLIEPATWRFTVRINRHAEDLADAIRQATGKPVSLLVNNTIVYRSQDDQVEGALPLRAQA